MRPSRKINIEHFFHNIILQKIPRHPEELQKLLLELHFTRCTELYGIKIFGINLVGKFFFKTQFVLNNESNFFFSLWTKVKL